MTTLADSLLEDLEELEEEEEEEQQQVGSGSSAVGRATGAEAASAAAGGEQDGAGTASGSGAMDVEEQARATDAKPTVGAIAGLRRTERYQRHIARVRKALEQDATGSHVARRGLLEGDPVYALIVASNQFLMEIKDELAAIHKFVADIYAQKFPELENMVPMQLDYLRVVRRIGNEMDMTLVDLTDLLSPSQIMMVSVTGSTTSGTPLSAEDLKRVSEACDEATELAKEDQTILTFVESRMNAVAPNVSAMVGTRIAAQLVGLAGGLAALARIPSCNVQLLGQERQALGGFSSAATIKHMGVLYFADLVQSAPPDLRQKACRAVAGKLTLCARVDAHGGDAAVVGELGAKFKAEVAAKIEKWQEPPPARTKKALPKPDDAPRRKRAGRRFRKRKELYEMTEMAKARNRMSFAQSGDEYGDDAMGKGLGMLREKGTTGTLRVQKKETRVAKRQRKAISTSSGATSGLSSSLAFTPVQGLELPNPESAAKRVREANEKYFGTSSGFFSVMKKQ